MTSRIGHVALGTWRRSPPRSRCHLCVGELSIQDAAPAKLPPSRRVRRARRRRALGSGSRDVGVPTKRNSAIASNGARTVKMSERALKSLRDHGPSKLLPQAHVLSDQRRPWPESGRNGAHEKANRPAPLRPIPGISREAMARVGNRPRTAILRPTPSKAAGGRARLLRMNGRRDPITFNVVVVG
jgi:hypothetical protein